MSLPSPSYPLSWSGSYEAPMCHPHITSWPGSRAAEILITAFLSEAHAIMAKGECVLQQHNGQMEPRHAVVHRFRNQKQ